MSGPMQWLNGQMVPVGGGVSNPGAIQPGVILLDVAHAVQQAPARQRKSAPKNVLSLAKARLREAKAELKKLRAVEKEVAELERLIAAAEDKPRAVVRELKKSAG